VKTIVSHLGEVFTHEMIAQDYGYASQSEYAGPTKTIDCSYPLDANSLQFGFPGMEKDIGAGAIYADIYGGGAITFSRAGSPTVIWQQGDVNRANAIADALNAKPYTSVQVHPGAEWVRRTLWHGNPSPYGLYQYFNIEGTYLGDSGQSTNNTSVSSTFCAYAYALGGAPMTRKLSTMATKRPSMQRTPSGTTPILSAIMVCRFSLRPHRFRFWYRNARPRLSAIMPQP
jgi:hypothetical protein